MLSTQRFYLYMVAVFPNPTQKPGLVSFQTWNPGLEEGSGSGILKSDTLFHYASVWEVLSDVCVYLQQPNKQQYSADESCSVSEAHETHSRGN